MDNEIIENPPVDKTEKTLSSECVYDAGFIRVMQDRVKLPNGKETGRTYVKHPGGVCVAAVDADGNVAFVRQYRYAM
ncbi:MAG: ADP-ribose pyrophosphatase, partial [Clostridia bacterium]|nr:ADP-ribose pyrophosphatase [Clostridia bacterium]